MDKKGFIHLVPLVVIGVVLVGSFGALSYLSEQRQKQEVGKVLSSSDGDGSGGSSRLRSSESSKSRSSDNDEDREESKPSSSATGGSSSSGPGSGKTKIESRTPTSRTKIKTGDDKTKVEVRNEEGRFETKVEEGKEETKIRTGGLRIEFKKEGDKVVLKVKNEQDKEVELKDEEEDELLKELEDELEEDEIKLATGSAQPGFIQRGHKVRTNFPLSVNPATGELFVTTPAGKKVVAILPDVAVQNMIRAGVLSRVAEVTIPPAEGTSAATVDGAGIELTEQQGAPVFVINGIRSERFLGLVPVDIKLRAVVSAENGSLIDINQSFFARLLDLLAF